VTDRGGVPLSAGKEFKEVKFPKEKICAFPEDKEKDAKDENNCADSA
jgi:hypothetical protein